MTSSTFMTLVVVLAFAESAQGCAPPIYGIGVFNASSGRISAVSIEYNLGQRLHEERYGSIGKGAYASVGGNPRPIPRRFTVRWNPDIGRARAQEVERPDIKDEGKFHGDVWFKISDTGVTVVPMTRDEETERAAQGLGIFD